VDTGVSGWPGSPHYGDQNDLWRTGRYLPMRFDPAEVKAAAKAKITLLPIVGKDCGCQ
jgi:penicillin amidase